MIIINLLILILLHIYTYDCESRHYLQTIGDIITETSLGNFPRILANKLSVKVPVQVKRYVLFEKLDLQLENLVEYA